MSDLNALYQELIIDHGHHPRHFGECKDAHRSAEGFNPLCGDKLTVYLKIDDATNTVDLVQFHGTGCAISIASASLMAENLQGKTIEKLQEVFQLFHQQATSDIVFDKEALHKLGKLSVLSGVRAFPSRVKCATLAWHTLQLALHQPGTVASTE